MSGSIEFNREGGSHDIECEEGEQEAKHVVMGPNSFRCLHCGIEQKVAMPCSINVLVGASNGFIEDHKDCEPSEAGESRFDYSDEYEWRNSWDTGLSSLVIWGVFKNYSYKPATPLDPADIGRCFRLLAVAPKEWRQNLERVGDANPEWRGLIDRWDELEKLYEEERWEDLYEAMKECRGEQ